MAKCGGLSEKKEASEEEQEICIQVKAEIEKQCGQSFEVFQAVFYKTQVVAGTMYYVKIKVAELGEKIYIHAKISKALPCYGSQLEVHGVQTNKTLDDEIEPF